MRFQGVPRNLLHETRFDRQKIEVKLRFARCPAHPFARNGLRSPKNEVKLRFQVVLRNPFARNEVRLPKTEVKLPFHLSREPFSQQNEVRASKAECKSANSSCSEQPFRTKWGWFAKNLVKLQFLLSNRDPFE